MQQDELDTTIDKFRLYLEKTSALPTSEKKDLIGNGLLFNVLYLIEPSKSELDDNVISECSFIVAADGGRIPSDADVNNILITATLLHLPFINISQMPSADEEAEDECIDGDDTDNESINGSELQSRGVKLEKYYPGSRSCGHHGILC